MSQFKQGDIVQLNHNDLSRDLIVERCSKDDKWVYCLWKDDADNLHREKFLADMLKNVKRGETTVTFGG
jgi:hypothetical protein